MLIYFVDHGHSTCLLHLRSTATGGGRRTDPRLGLPLPRVPARTGSAFGLQARFARQRIDIAGKSRQYVRISDDGEPRTFNFCPDCGATVYHGADSAPDVVAVPVGAFADPDFPAPSVSVWESRRHAWVTLPAGIEHAP